MKLSLNSIFLVTLATFVLILALLAENVFAAPTTGVLSIHPARQSPGVTKIKRQWPPGVSVSDGGSASGRKVRASPPWEDVSNTPDNA
ncbi:hypothetical protein SCLCIDRAFT_1212291 [Scleroderma citrinum Foug A]|uniref:Uncharacterized protein n=1 Tax=Scleroderma citrinum Foug A TaxID=1036808 RepID=A0A0C2ZVN1_9AGAM|nr:hypothetical protein SCLCIDRAFT_1212291 [Scleroderma citrinum Foug A]